MPQKLCCAVQDIIDHGSRVYSLRLKPNDSLPRFQAGQFLHLALDDYHPGDYWPDSRPFSIASPPTERNFVRITYAVKGRFTSRMEAEITTHRQVWVNMPFGEFIIQSGNEICLLAGGTGITAFSGFISSLTEKCRDRITLGYGARRSDLLIYRPLIDTALTRCPNFQATYFSEHIGNNPGMISGRVRLDPIWDMLQNQGKTHFYLSGPPEMLHSLSRTLADRLISNDQIHIDAWE